MRAVRVGGRGGGAGAAAAAAAAGSQWGGRATEEMPFLWFGRAAIGGGN